MSNKIKEEQSNIIRQRTPREPLKDRTTVFLGALTLALAFVFILIAPKFFAQTAVSLGMDDQTVIDEVQYRHPLSGLSLDEPLEDLQIYGVMIDNHVDAWPPAGIDQAALVIEAPVEASISRMLAFFSEDQHVEAIGPVRSARPYYLDWNNELDALYAHVGGSNTALDLIASGGTFDFNQYWNGGFYWRSSYRYAPHNVFTSTEDMAAYVEERDEAGRAPELLYGVWKFDDSMMEGDDVTAVAIDFSAPTYYAEWEYNVEQNRYVRSQAGLAHKTDEGNQIMANNVVVVVTDIEVIDSVGRRDVRTTGEGEGYLFQDGVMMEVTWRKPSATERLRFYNEDDQEVAMNAGITWIEVIGSVEDMKIEE